MSATKLLAAFTALASLAAAATPALSADPDQVSVRVKVADLNLATESGARTALSRIHTAADGICGGQPSSIRDLAATAHYSACMNVTVGTAVASAHQPMLAAVASHYLPPPTQLAAR
jgi:UrcA family protein